MDETVNKLRQALKDADAELAFYEKELADVNTKLYQTSLPLAERSKLETHRESLTNVVLDLEGEISSLEDELEYFTSPNVPDSEYGETGLDYNESGYND
jgi:chromosome segregation ATPase